MPRVSFFLCAMLLVSTCLTATRAENYGHLHVQVVHNHGVRLPITPHNETSICDKGNSCGDLRDDGSETISKMVNILKDLARIQKDSEFENFLFILQFNTTLMHSRSTDETRTLQSSNNFFAQFVSVFPPLSATHTTDLKTDVLLNTRASPAVYFQYKYGMPEIRNACNPLMRELGLNSRILQDIGKEVSSEGYCSDEKKGVDCAMLLCDIGTSYAALFSSKDSYKLLKQYLGALCQVSICVSNFTLGYDRGNPLNVLQGSKGQVLARELLTNMHDYLNNKSKVILHEYSANGDAIASLASTLGVHSPLTLHPPFGMSLVFFLRTVDGHPRVSVFAIYSEDRSFFTKWKIAKLPQMVTVAEKDLVPSNLKGSFDLEEFENLINSSAPKSKEGLCYLDPVLKERMNCSEAGEEGTNHSLNEDCLFYQRQCSAFISKPGYRLSLPNYTYYRIANVTVVTNLIGLSFNAIVVICIAAFMIGLLLGLLFFYVRKRCITPPKSNDSILNSP